MTTRREKHPREKPGAERAGKVEVDLGLGGLFKGLGSFIELLSDLSERQGHVIERHGEVGEEKGVRAVYGFTMRVGGEGRPHVEPFGNVQKGKSGHAEVRAVREPIVDVLEEDGGIRVVAEMPGVEEPDVHYDLEEEALVIRAVRGDRRYEKRVDLPARVLREIAGKSFRNGIFELRLKTANGKTRA